jgi:hypothetical protein
VSIDDDFATSIPIPTPLRIPLKTFYRGPVPHEMGVTCSINNLEFDALSHTGSGHSHLKPALMDKIRDHFPMRRDNPPQYPLGYRTPLTIHSKPWDNRNQDRSGYSCQYLVDLLGEHESAPRFVELFGVLQAILR